MEKLAELFGTIAGYVWGVPLIVLLVGTGLLLTARLLFIQVRAFGHAVALVSGKYDNPEDKGEVTHFQALCAALSGTIGNGNIVGVATAIAAGGPGAVLWMWVTALVGMATKFTSCLLGMKFRTIHEDGSVSGGPMYYLEKGTGQKWLAMLFALFAMCSSLGQGNMVQANSVAHALSSNLALSTTTEQVKAEDGTMVAKQVTHGVPTIATGLVLAVLVGLVTIGGIKRIARVASWIVPFMCIVYVLGATWILVSHMDMILPALKTIFWYAFHPTPATIGGGFAGAVVARTIRFGVARGVFSNESGLGSAPIAHAAARTNEPVREGLVAMLGPFIDTIVICSMTALVVIMSGKWQALGANGKVLDGAPLTAAAFNWGIQGIGSHIVTFGIVFFAFSTIITWSYYGDRCAEYLIGGKAVIIYRWLYVFMIPIGATFSLHVIWNFSDIFTGLMALPNLIALVLLHRTAMRETKDYMSRPHTPSR